MSRQAVRVPARWPLVGRGEELDTVAAALSDPRCQGVLVSGPAGVGKTRLAEWRPRGGGAGSSGG